MKPFALLALLVLPWLAIGPGSTRTALAAPAGEVPVGQPLREALLKGLNGPDRPLSSYRGKPLVINVWASWCGPCRDEMASLERLAWREQATPFTVIGLSTDDDPALALGFMKAAHSTINQYIDVRLQLEQMLGASRLPLTLLVDGMGRVLRKVFGAQAWDGPEAVALIERAFRPQRPR